MVDAGTRNGWLLQLVPVPLLLTVRAGGGAAARGFLFVARAAVCQRVAEGQKLTHATRFLLFCFRGR